MRIITDILLASTAFMLFIVSLPIVLVLCIMSMIIQKDLMEPYTRFLYGITDKFP